MCHERLKERQLVGWGVQVWKHLPNTLSVRLAPWASIPHLHWSIKASPFSRRKNQRSHTVSVLWDPLQEKKLENMRTLFSFG